MTGKEFEKEIVKVLSNNGFWVVPPRICGTQSCDIIAIRNNVPYLIECKYSKTYFNSSREEVNQLLSMKHFKACGNTNTVWCLGFSNGEIIINNDGEKSLFSEWLESL